MLRIRASQNRKLVDDQLNQFIHELVDQLQDIISEPQSPQLFDMGNIKKYVEKGTSNSNSYGVSSRTNLRRYHECMEEYGVDINLNAALPWAFESALNKKSEKLPVDMYIILDENLGEIPETAII